MWWGFTVVNSAETFILQSICSILEKVYNLVISFFQLVLLATYSYLFLKKNRDGAGVRERKRKTKKRSVEICNKTAHSIQLKI